MSRTKKYKQPPICSNTNLNQTSLPTMKIKYLLKTNSFILLITPWSLEPRSPSKYLLFLIYVPVQLKQRTKFKWILQNKWTYPSAIKDLDASIIKQRSFQEKVIWFRFKLQQRKVSWVKGSENIKVDRHNILISSYEQLAKLNIQKQVKVNFTDEKGENDAGGIFREWLNMCMKEIFGNKFGLFTLCETTETSYKFTINQNTLNQCQKISSLLGYLIAKALMEKVPINCHLNFTIWRQILQQRITLDDVYSYDKSFYQSWKCMLETPGACEDLNFTVQLYDSFKKKHKSLKLIDKGQDILVTQQNKELYFQKLIQAYCVKYAAKAIVHLKKTLYQIIPVQYLNIFQPYEIDALLCGQEAINMQDWKQNTQYQGYTTTDQMIQWFWQVMQCLDQQMLRNMLHYCTGCSRVPVTGFKYLESNRGQIKHFTIKKISVDEYNKFPRSYTCFNRLQLPVYQSFDELSMRIYSICSQQINQINIDA